MALVLVGLLGLFVGSILARALSRGRLATSLGSAPPWLPSGLVTAALFVLASWRLTQLDLRPAIPAWLAFMALGVPLTLIDLKVRRLPNVLVLPGYPVVGALLAGAAIAGQDWWSLARAGIGAAVLFGFYFLLALLSPAGMGFGDVKLSGLLGLVLGYLSWSALLLGAFLGFALGALAAMAMIAAGRGTRRTALPFGPFMITGAALTLWLAHPVAVLQ